MALVRKIDPEWFPSENKNLMVGETINIDNPETLIKEGKVEVAKEEVKKEEKKEKTLKQMNKKELLIVALEKGIAVNPEASNKEIVKAIEACPVAPVKELKKEEPKA